MPPRWKEQELNRVRYKQKYHTYLRSPEWYAKKRKVGIRSDWVCERCRKHEAYAVHHLTYARVFHEPLSDLLHVCEGCHDYLHGHSSEDPCRAS